METTVTLEALRHRVRDLRWQAATDYGQDLLEYAMLAALIAIVAIGAVTTLGRTIDTPAAALVLVLLDRVFVAEPHSAAHQIPDEKFGPVQGLGY